MENDICSNGKSLTVLAFHKYLDYRYALTRNSWIFGWLWIHPLLTQRNVDMLTFNIELTSWIFNPLFSLRGGSFDKYLKAVIVSPQISDYVYLSSTKLNITKMTHLPLYNNMKVSIGISRCVYFYLFCKNYNRREIKHTHFLFKIYEYEPLWIK